jgi:hypothetical protein
MIVTGKGVLSATTIAPPPCLGASRTISKAEVDSLIGLAGGVSGQSIFISRLLGVRKAIFLGCISSSPISFGPISKDKERTSNPDAPFEISSLAP